MITKEQALTANEFHFAHSSKIIVGPRGGQTMPRIEVWRRNGKTKTWKTRPELFRIPVKYGLYDYSYITEKEAQDFHTTEDCPLRIDDTKTYMSPYLKDA
jgi:hypothetical protein